MFPTSQPGALTRCSLPVANGIAFSFRMARRGEIEMKPLISVASLGRVASLFACIAGFASFTIAPVCAQEPLFGELPSDAHLSAYQAALVELAKTSDAAT